MEPATAGALARHALKRAQGQLRKAVAGFAELADGVDVVGEVHLEKDDGLDELVEAVRLARHRYAAIDVVVLSTPGHARGRERQPEESAGGTPPEPAPRA